VTEPQWFEIGPSRVGRWKRSPVDSGNGSAESYAVFLLGIDDVNSPSELYRLIVSVSGMVPGGGENATYFVYSRQLV